MSEPRAATSYAEGKATEFFEKVGDLGARVDAHDERSRTVESSLRTYDGRAQQIQAQIVRVTVLCESLAASLGTVERYREEDAKELRAALIDALKAAPRNNRGGSIFGMVLAMVALAAMIVVLLGRAG